ncbi:uncharacterized protein OCT59_013718 [Rhizophagus irregularis]|uniref:uncharacterized protein n=1 Tax=Rhizophagus irregularis TaxID=588596 RepID=UPI003325427D|nr:hypothetical protein OCT59_013718 [Rhizophagus irregularis]
MLSELELLRQQVGELEVKPNQLLRLQEYFRMFKAYIICLGRKSESNGVDIIPDDEPWLGELLLDEGIDCEFFLVSA